MHSNFINHCLYIDQSIYIMPRYQRVYVYSPFPCLYSVCISFHDSLINSLGSAEVICTTRRKISPRHVQNTKECVRLTGYKGVATQLLIQQLVHCTIDSAIDTYTACKCASAHSSCQKMVTE